MNEFKRQMKDAGYTQASFSAETGTPIDTVKNWTRGRSCPPAIAFAYLNLVEAENAEKGELARIIIASHQFDQEGRKINCNCENCIKAKKALYS